MKFGRFSIILFVIGILGLMGFVSAEKTYASEKEGIETLKTPEEIQKFREEYIKNFRRTGLNTAPGDARFLRIMVASAGSKRGIEVGTATGFGAINMGMAFERNGGELISLDIDHRMVVAAEEHIKNMGLEKTVKVVEGDALKTIPELEGEFDFMFIDALKQDYMKYFQLALPKLKVGSVIVADNVILHANAMKDFLDFMEASPDYDMQIIRSSMEKGDGMAVIYKLR
ncbi:MAG: class I SAM-dependent methyltransferase [Candidatus Omnitrophica bacterium]|nr:class I SAM-dependent methyltransferase [Candidatus Omnitrophota bacterium]